MRRTSFRYPGHAAWAITVEGGSEACMAGDMVMATADPARPCAMVPTALLKPNDWLAVGVDDPLTCSREWALDVLGRDIRLLVSGERGLHCYSIEEVREVRALLAVAGLGSVLTSVRHSSSFGSQRGLRPDGGGVRTLVVHGWTAAAAGERDPLRLQGGILRPDGHRSTIAIDPGVILHRVRSSIGLPVAPMWPTRSDLAHDHVRPFMTQRADEARDESFNMITHHPHPISVRDVRPGFNGRQKPTLEAMDLVDGRAYRYGQELGRVPLTALATLDRAHGGGPWPDVGFGTLWNVVERLVQLADMTLLAHDVNLDDGVWMTLMPPISEIRSDGPDQRWGTIVTIVWDIGRDQPGIFIRPFEHLCQVSGDAAHWLPLHATPDEVRQAARTVLEEWLSRLHSLESIAAAADVARFLNNLVPAHGRGPSGRQQAQREVGHYARLRCCSPPAGPLTRRDWTMAALHWCGDDLGRRRVHRVLGGTNHPMPSEMWDVA